MKIKLILFFALCGLSFSTSAFAQISPATNFIAVDINMPQNTSFNYDSCFAIGTNLGMSRVGLFQNWTNIETAPTIYNLAIFDIANAYYPAHSMPIDLTIAPISTNNLEVPSDLTSTTFDSPAMINRFKILLDSIKIHIPSVTLSSLVIGSEHDVYFGSNATQWAQYTVFYDSVSAHAKILWPGLKVATELTFPGIVNYNSFAQTLNTNSDYIGVSYYPLNTNFTVMPVSVVPTDFATLAGLYLVKPICFYQYGYPSSTSCNSSETQQAQFITETFTAWDAHAANIKMIDFTWLHDLDTALVNYYGTYYGISDTVFLEYLHTLGFRTWNGSGTDKMALNELRCQAKLRGYNALPICFVNVEELNEENSFSVSPNPAQDYFMLHSDFPFVNAEVKIFNVLGQCKKAISTINGQNWKMDVADLPIGIYLVTIKNENFILSKKIVINR